MNLDKMIMSPNLGRDCLGMMLICILTNIYVHNISVYATIYLYFGAYIGAIVACAIAFR